MNWSKEKIIVSIRQHKKKTGILPIKNKFKKPVNSVVRNYFGTWNNAIKQAGFYPRKHKDQRQPIIEFLNKDKLKKGCDRCGYNKYPVALHYHHLRDKKFGIARFWIYTYSLKEIKKEISKCVVICANCHAQEHSSQLNLKERK